MSVRMGLLALLTVQPSYGYQLRGEFDARTGGAWPVNAGQVYATLDRLERDGLVGRDGIDEEGRVRYSITIDGSAAVAAWVTAPTERQAGRDDLAMKLALSVSMPGVDVAQVVQAQRAASMKALQELTRTKPVEHTPSSVAELAWALVVEALLFQVEAEMRWLDYAEGLIEEAVAAGITAAPLAPPVRRGRPSKQQAIRP